MFQIVKEIKNILCKGDDRRYPQFLTNRGTALFDYDEIYVDPALGIITALQDYRFTNPCIALFMELPVLDKGYSNPGNEKQVVLLALRLKMLLHLIEKLLNHKVEHSPAIEYVTEKIKNEVAGRIIANVDTLTKQNEYRVPPIIIENLYFDCQFYEKHYLSPLFLNSALPIYSPYLDGSIEAACRIVQSTPYSKRDNFWFIQINDENSAEITRKHLRSNWAIILTPQTLHFASQIYSDQIIWLLSTETQWKEADEPVVMFDGKRELLLGLSSPGTNLKPSDAKGSVLIDKCVCQNNIQDRAWMCTKCKILLHVLRNKDIRCMCGLQKANNLKKVCFKCISAPTVTEKSTPMEVDFPAKIQEAISTFGYETLVLAPN